jgi:hypothetical protein
MAATAPKDLSDPNDETRLTDFLRDTIEKSQIHDLRVRKITVCSNVILEKKFKDVSGPSSTTTFLFHGLRAMNDPALPSFVYTGIESKLLQSTDSWYYGKGFYLTSSIDFALFYQFGLVSTVQEVTDAIKERSNIFKMLVFACNLGRCQEFNGSSDSADWRTTTYGKPLSHDIDSRHMIVGRSGTRTLKFYPREAIAPHELDKRSIYDEYVVQNGNRAYPMFCVEFQFIERVKNIVIWRDRKVRNEENTGYFQHIQNQFKDQVTLIGAENDDKALEEIDDIWDKAHLYVITNRGDHGADFLRKCREHHVTKPCLVFTQCITGWDKEKGDLENVSIDCSSKAIETFIKNHIPSA